MSSLAEAARSLGLNRCASIVDAYKPGIPQAASPDAALRAADPNSVTDVLGRVVRRGLDPKLVGKLRSAWEHRPLERSLLAWDVLNGSILGATQLVDDLRTEARRISSILPKPGRAYVSIRPDAIEALMTNLGVPAVRSLSGRALEDAVAEQALGARRVMGVAPNQQMLDLARQHARLLHRAHLPTMAAFHLADLYFHHQYEPALVDLLEVLLDYGAPDVESWLGTLDGSSMVELITYARVRTLNNKEAWEQALAFADKHRAAIDSLKLPPAEAARINPRPTLAYTEAALRNGKAAVPYECIAAITGLEMPWRYAFRVLLLYAATRIRDMHFVDLLNSFIERFGNDFHVWYDPMAAAPNDVQWGRGYIAVLAREGEALPHEPSIWKAASVLLSDDGAAGFDEVQARLRAQATLG